MLHGVLYPKAHGNGFKKKKNDCDIPTRIPFSSTSSGHRESTSPPIARLVLHSLTHFSFQGSGEYLQVDNLVAHIGAPLPNKLSRKFFIQLVLDAPQPLQGCNISVAWFGSFRLRRTSFALFAIVELLRRLRVSAPWTTLGKWHGEHSSANYIPVIYHH